MGIKTKQGSEMERGGNGREIERRKEKKYKRKGKERKRGKKRIKVEKGS